MSWTLTWRSDRLEDPSDEDDIFHGSFTYLVVRSDSLPSSSSRVDYESDEEINVSIENLVIIFDGYKYTGHVRHVN